MKRRDFLKLGGLSATGSLLGACTMPHRARTVVPYVEQPAESIPGVPNTYATTCTMCRAGCGMLARVIEGRAVKLEGNPAHPVNRGKLCALAQASLQRLYHPDRIQGPLRRQGERGNASFQSASWEVVLAAVGDRLRALAGKDAVAVLSAPLNGTRGRVFESFARALGGRGPVTLDLENEETLLVGGLASLGLPRLPFYDIANARMVLSFGADFLGTWLSPVQFGRFYGAMRQDRPGVRGTLVHFEPRMSLTGACADAWIAVRPGTEGMVALGIAQSLMTQGLAKPGFADMAPSLEAHAPERTAADTGIQPEVLHELARDFATISPALALAGGAAIAQTNGVSVAEAVHLLNLLVGSAGMAGGVMAGGGVPVRELQAFRPSRFQDVQDLVSRMRSGRIQALLVAGVDPSYLLPASSGFQEALQKVPLIISFSSVMDDTTTWADWVLPDHTFLESWGVVVPEPGAEVPSLGSQQPVVSPVFDTRPTPDVLLSLGRTLGPDVARALPWGSYAELVESTWTDLGGAELWLKARQEGVWVGKASPQVQVRPASRPLTLPRSEQSGDASEYPFFFYPFLTPNLHDGRAADLPHLQELPELMSAGVWSSWIELQVQAAERMGLVEGDAVELRSPHGKLRARVHLSPGLHPDVIAMPMGQGHRAMGRYASNRGANPLAILAPLVVQGSGDWAWGGTRVRLSKVEEAPSFTRVERQPWPPQKAGGPGFLSLQDLREQTWPWDGRHDRSR